MNSKRIFFKKILTIFFFTFLPFKLIQNSKYKKKIFKKKFSKIWLIASDDI